MVATVVPMVAAVVQQSPDQVRTARGVHMAVMQAIQHRLALIQMAL